jgi:hypothetical protein
MNIPFRINQLRTLQFAIFPDKFVNGISVSVDTKVTFGVRKDLGDIKCVMDIRFRQEDNLLLTSQTQCNFGISPEGATDLREKGHIPVDFLRHIATITTGTVRGIIHSKTEGTVLNPIVLPPINLVNLIHDDILLDKVE